MKSRVEKQLTHFLQLNGVRRYIVACVLGLLATATLPPLHILPLAFVAFSGLFLLIHSAKTGKQAFWTGWWFGLGHFVSGLYWFAFALLTDAEKFGWMIPFAVFGISGILALYVALVGWISIKIPMRHTVSKLFVFSVLWVAIEWARAYLFTGFPWNLIGYAWAISDEIIQLGSVVGIYGLSLLYMTVALAPVLFIDIARSRIRYSLSGIILLLLPVIAWSGGTMRLAQAEHNVVEGVTLRIVQANIEQHHKWKPELRAAHLQKYMKLTQQDGLEDVTHVIWPEAALPYMVDGAPWLLTLLRNMAPATGSLITGGVRTDFNNTNDYHVWNSLYSISRKNGIESFYDKFHLVPFGEYIPFRSILPVDKITHGSKDFSSGSGPQILTMPHLPPFLPLICYEVIFPQHLMNSEGASWILNITNDAWFGNSSGPYQHFTMARMRAIEQGIPLVRAANTGISAIINSYGITEKKLGLLQTGIMDTSLPSAISNRSTYSRYGNLFLLVIIIMIGSTLLFFEYRAR